MEEFCLCIDIYDRCDIHIPHLVYISSVLNERMNEALLQNAHSVCIAADHKMYKCTQDLLKYDCEMWRLNHLLIVT